MRAGSRLTVTADGGSVRLKSSAGRSIFQWILVHRSLGNVGEDTEKGERANEVEGMADTVKIGFFEII